MAADLETSIARRTHGNWLSWLVNQQTFWVSVAAIVAFVVLSLVSDVFATRQNCSTWRATSPSSRSAPSA